ncbi:solute carrier family 22 member 2-like [Clytia hemisphaerica]|uniref:solute carrier family 22 member 2-like n=1 Tax=Clytia hemisphaerica TaxID=252671 RepID=UPI0034D4C466
MSEGKEKDDLNVDDFLGFVGEFGKFQKILTLIFAFMLWPYFFVYYVMYFAALKPEWRCAANRTACQFNGTFTHEDKYRCGISRSDWEYVQPKDYSIIVQYDLSCDNDWLVFLATSITFVGGVFGAVFLGWYSDNFGRKKILYVCFFFVILTNFLLIFMPSIASFIVFRFMTGFLVASVYPCYYVTLNETVGEKYRAIAGNTLWFLYTAALCMMSLKSYLLDNWKYFIIACTLPYLPFLLSYNFVPESVRWLRLKGRMYEAMKIFRRMADWNGKVLDPTVMLSPGAHAAKMTSPIDVFRNGKRMAIHTVILIYCFYATALIYYGLSLAADNLGAGSIHLNFVLLSLVEFPAAIISAYSANRFGRLKSTAIPIFLSGVLTVIIPFIPDTSTTTRVIRVFVGIFGKFWITFCFDVIEVLVCEVYPTNIRSEAFSIMSISNWVGGASAPWVSKGLERFDIALPYYVMGIIGIVAGCLCYFLPETNGAALKEINDEVNNTSNKVDTEMANFSKDRND